VNKLETITIANANGIELKVTNYGATIMGLKVPDRNNNLVDVVVGLSDVSNYIQPPYTDVMLFLGSTVGRYAGRISKGKFEVDGETYPVQHHNGVHLHGGEVGFDKRYWTVKRTTKNAVTLEYLSPNLENGYPGNLEVQATFEITEQNALHITYKAKTDKTTPLNMTIHPYINLNGRGSVLDHDLLINSDQYLEVDNQLIPTGKLLDSKNTAFDRTQKSKVNKEGFKGFDDTFVLNNEKIKASFTSNENGINMNVYTNQPAMVIYTPKQFPDLPYKEKSNTTPFPAICFEPQNFPDAPHNSHFPNSILRPNDEYNNEIVFEFTIV
jgi:aldose 1-epimerase